MNAKELAASLAISAALVATAVVIIEPKDDKPASAQEKLAAVEPSKLALLPDAGKGYVLSVRVADGGVEKRTTAPDCVRRPVGNKTCFRAESDGGQRNPGELNRFPATDVRGSGCQPVACSVFLGESADEEEDARLSEAKDAGRIEGGTK